MQRRQRCAAVTGQPTSSLGTTAPAAQPADRSSEPGRGGDHGTERRPRRRRTPSWTPGPARGVGAGQRAAVRSPAPRQRRRDPAGHRDPPAGRHRREPGAGAARAARLPARPREIRRTPATATASGSAAAAATSAAAAAAGRRTEQRERRLARAATASAQHPPRHGSEPRAAHRTARAPRWHTATGVGAARRYRAGAHGSEQHAHTLSCAPGCAVAPSAGAAVRRLAVGRDARPDQHGSSARRRINHPSGAGQRIRPERGDRPGRRDRQRPRRRRRSPRPAARPAASQCAPQRRRRLPARARRPSLERTAREHTASAGDDPSQLPACPAADQHPARAGVRPAHPGRSTRSAGRPDTGGRPPLDRSRGDEPARPGWQCRRSVGAGRRDCRPVPFRPTRRCAHPSIRSRKHWRYRRARAIRPPAGPHAGSAASPAMLSAPTHQAHPSQGRHRRPNCARTSSTRSSSGSSTRSSSASWTSWNAAAAASTRECSDADRTGEGVPRDRGRRADRLPVQPVVDHRRPQQQLGLEPDAGRRRRPAAVPRRQLGHAEPRSHLRHHRATGRRSATTPAS